jgi:ParB family transcriptional regulator, chromosome partitioning protein
MSSAHGRWISRRGQADAELAIDQVIDRQPQPGEQIQQVLNELIEDSSYQARQPFSDESVEELAQGMREVSFQGVLIVRPHGDVVKRRRGMFQLVYGHRRRLAWRRVCEERGAPCLLPVIVRDVSDERMLVIGAQENLQRQDLDPLEEAQIVAWHLRMFSDKNQAEIGALLGKSSDWVSTRARVHKLPDALKERLRRRPRAISQMLELSPLYAQQPEAALNLAERVVHENLTLEAIRALVRGYTRPERRTSSDREGEHNRRGAATSVQDVTNGSSVMEDHRSGEQREDGHVVLHTSRAEADDLDFYSSPGSVLAPSSLDAVRDGDNSHTRSHGAADQQILQEVAAALTAAVAHAEQLGADRVTAHALDQVEQALMSLRRTLVLRAHPDIVPAQPRSYRLIDTDLREILVLLHHHRPVVATLRPTQTEEPAVHLVMCLLPKSEAHGGLPNTNVGDLFVAVADAGNGTIPFTNRVLVEWVCSHLQVTQDEAAIIAALLSDLVQAQATAEGLAESP